MKFGKIMTAMLMCVLALSLASCDGKKSSDPQDEESKGEWWDVSREGMEEKETTSEESSSKVETTSSTVEATSSDTDASSQTDSGSSNNGKGNSKSQRTNRNGDGTTEEEYYEDPDTPTEVFSPDIVIFGNKNMSDSASLCDVTVNGKTLSITDETVDTFINKAGVRQNKACSFLNPFELDDSYDGVFWYGKGYGIYTNTVDESKRFTGTQVFIEGLDYASVAGEVDPSVEGAYRIRSVYSSIGATKSDFTVNYIGGVEVGMSKSDIEGKLGKASETKGYAYYANSSGALVIRYDKNDIAVEIYLFADYADIPIEYQLSEAPSEESTTSSQESKTTTTALKSNDTSPDIPPDAMPSDSKPKRVE